MMKIPKHTKNALVAMERLSNLGLPYPIQQRIGAFAVSWGLFESNLERAVWALQKEDVKGVRPSTDKSQVSDWIAVLENGSGDLTATANEVLRIAAQAAIDLMHYRHALMHGTLVALPGAAFIIRNPKWHGELRKRKSGDAHIEENLLDLAIDSAWVLYRVAMCAEKASGDPEFVLKLEELKPDAQRIKSYANELRHLSALMNHEKY
jgi:hypothetical protein